MRSARSRISIIISAGFINRLRSIECKLPNKTGESYGSFRVTFFFFFLLVSRYASRHTPSTLSLLLLIFPFLFFVIYLSYPFFSLFLKYFLFRTFTLLRLFPMLFLRYSSIFPCFHFLVSFFPSSPVVFRVILEGS